MHFLWKSLCFRLAAAPGQEAANPGSRAPTLRHGSTQTLLPPQPALWTARSLPHFSAASSPLLAAFKQGLKGHLSSEAISTVD